MAAALRFLYLSGSENRPSNSFFQITKVPAARAKQAVPVRTPATTKGRGIAIITAVVAALWGLSACTFRHD